MSTASLRSRLGLFTALALGVVAFIASLGIVVASWSEARTTLRSDVEFAAFRLADASSLAEFEQRVAELTGPIAENGFVVALDREANVVYDRSGIDDEDLTALIELIWVDITGADEAISIDLAAEGEPGMPATGAGCLEASICDTLLVGATETTLGPFVLARFVWVVLATAAAAALGYVGARFLVGRSLRPVDAMRAELDRITESDLDRRVPLPGSGDELERLGQSMNGVIARLGTAVEANERFVADAAHELRSPIAGVRAALDVERSKQPPTDTPSLLDDSVTELERAGRLVDDLLVLARRQGGSTGQLVTVDLDDIARAVAQRWQTQRPELQIEVDTAPVQVRGNIDQLHRIVANLVDNAVRHGGGRVGITTSADGRTAVVRVEDDGPGIPLADRQRVFERFSRLDESRARKTGGSGLGLAIASELATDHGGELTVAESTMGGAAFELRLPGHGSVR